MNSPPHNDSEQGVQLFSHAPLLIDETPWYANKDGRAYTNSSRCISGFHSVILCLLQRGRCADL